MAGVSSVLDFGGAEAQTWLRPIDVMNSNSALQYTPDPEDTLKRLCHLRAKRMTLGRITLSKAMSNVNYNLRYWAITVLARWRD
jgi:trans-aconitate methyltransferase